MTATVHHFPARQAEPEVWPPVRLEIKRWLR